MGDIRSYRDLVAWQKAMGLAKRVYGATKLAREQGYGDDVFAWSLIPGP